MAAVGLVLTQNDLTIMPIEEVFLTLSCDEHGLTSEAAEQRLAICGHNKLEEKKEDESKVSKFLWFMCNSCVVQIAFTRKKHFGKEERELKWAHAQRTLHGLHPPETKMFGDRGAYTELNQMAEEAKRRAEIARLKELHTLKGHVESVVRLKGLDMDAIQQAYTV